MMVRMLIMMMMAYTWSGGEEKYNFDYDHHDKDRDDHDRNDHDDVDNESDTTELGRWQLAILGFYLKFEKTLSDANKKQTTIEVCANLTISA